MTELNKISQFAASMLKAATLDDSLWSIAKMLVQFSILMTVSSI